MSQRHELENRRRNSSRELLWKNQRYTVTAGFYPDGRLGEIFIDGRKAGSEATQHAQDAAVLVSLLLQHNVPPKEIAHSITGPLAMALDLFAEAS